MRFPRFFAQHEQREGPPAEQPVVVEHHVVELEPQQLKALSRVFAAPRWLRDLGLASWLLAGVAVLLVGIVWLAAVTATITGPVLIGLVVAVVASPIVGWLKRHGVARAGGAAIVLVGLVVVAVLVGLLVVGGITSQIDDIKAQANDAAPKVQSWLRDLGINRDGARSVTDQVRSATPDAISTLVHGVVHGIQGIASLAFGLSFTALALFFLLKDGPSMRDWVDGHVGVPRPVARVITGSVIQSLRRYFAGVTLVAAFNGVVVGLGALILDVPLAGTIAIVAFVTAYVPYIGAIVAGTFAVVLALGAKGTTTALIMLVIFILANGLLQNIFQPIAFGATLKLNPLVVLIVTIGSGCLFGMVGLVLAAPLLSAAIQISGRLAVARAEAGLLPPPDEPVPDPTVLVDGT
jgi:predicted PurR-regulated permease PerM